MKISPAGCSETAENPLPGSSAGESNAQIALAFDSSGNHEIVAEAPGAHDGRRSTVRKSWFDTRRTAEFLGERGRLPAEALHLITRRTLAEAVAYIRNRCRAATTSGQRTTTCGPSNSCCRTAISSRAIWTMLADLTVIHALVAGHLLAASTHAR
jgi:hypothetical protein